MGSFQPISLCHSRCIIILARITIGPRSPRGSNNLAISLKTWLFVGTSDVAVIGLTRKRKSSPTGSQKSPSVLTTPLPSLSSKLSWISWSSGGTSFSNSGSLAHHFRSLNPALSNIVSKSLRSFVASAIVSAPASASST
uniref:(northern house mosquito) hypothetical protein n=1 Tax=Culex pipiens TaxID=7175 RepID=A0A8D8FBQ4_CULPI